MNTYLFAWNPDKWDWTDLEENIENLKMSGSVTQKWSCVSHRQIKPGDRAFLVRLGVEPKGIMGSGTVVSEPFLSQHWSGEDKLVHRVLIEFDTLLNPTEESLLNIDILDQGELSNQVWTPQSSGISIKPELTDELEAVWFDFLNAKISSNRFEKEKPRDSFSEGASSNVSITRYERNPHARKACLKHYGYACTICEFDFQEFYGEAGKEFIHVHHLNEISGQDGEYEINPVNDLRPVCPNCHAIIHRKRPAYIIEEMRNMVKSKQSAT